MHGNRIEDVGLTAQISGFGATESDKGENSNNLLVLTVQTVSNEMCRNALGTIISNDHICTIDLVSNTGFCTTGWVNWIASNFS